MRVSLSEFKTDYKIFRHENTHIQVKIDSCLALERV